MFDKSWIVQKATRCWIKEPKCWYGDYFHVNNDENCDTSWTQLPWEFDYLQEHQFRRAQDVVRHHAEVEFESEALDSECFHDWVAIYSLHEICFATWQSTQVEKSEGACLFRLSSLFGKDAWTTRGQGKVERSASIFPGVRHTTLQILKEIEEIMTGLQTIPEEFEDRIIFMSMFNDIDWTQKGNYKECFSNSDKVKDFAKRFPLGHGLFSVQEKKKMAWNALSQTWRTVEYYCRCHGCRFQRQRTSSIQSFQCVGSEILEEKKGGRCTIRFSAEPSNAELSFRTNHSANQLSIYGAIADWCDELIDSANTWSIISQHGEIRSCVENWSLRKWIRWYEHLGRLFKQRGIDCASIKKDLKSYQER